MRCRAFPERTMSWSSILGRRGTMNVERQGTSDQPQQWWCVGQSEWWQRWQPRLERGRHTTFVQAASRGGASYARSWKLDMRLAEQPDASVVTPPPTSPSLKTSYFISVCNCSC